MEAKTCLYNTISIIILYFLQWQKKKIEEINVGGTNNVLQGKVLFYSSVASRVIFCVLSTACIACGVGALVYTSTVNVVAGGKEIVEGREDNTPYIPLDQVSKHQDRLYCQLCNPVELCM